MKFFLKNQKRIIFFVGKSIIFLKYYNPGQIWWPRSRLKFQPRLVYTGVISLGVVTLVPKCNPLLLSSFFKSVKCSESETYTQRNLFDILSNKNEIRLHLPFSDWFGTAKGHCPFLVQNELENGKYYLI